MFHTWKEVLEPRKSARRNHSGPPGADLTPARGADSEAFDKDSKFLLSFIQVFIEDLLCARLGYSSDYMDKVPSFLVFPDQSRRRKAITRLAIHQ